MSGAGGLRIVYVVGAKNSGSTLLDAILGNAPGAQSLGEVGGFHRFAIAEACECRRPPAGCRLCGAVVASLEAHQELDAFHRLAPLPLRERRLHWTVLRSRAATRYAHLADLVFAAVAEETGSRVLIDSSKNVARAAALVHHSRNEVLVVHLVRDGRGYLASRRRRATADGRRHAAPLALGAWMVKNLLVSVLLKPQLAPGRYLLCRYEDLVGDPARELRRLGTFAGLDTSALAEAATGEGLARGHLFEPRRRADYRWVRLDRQRLGSQRASAARSAAYWACGGFVSRWWGYDRRQSYLPSR